MAGGEEPVKKSLCLSPLLEPETSTEEPSAALGIMWVAAFTCGQTESNPIGSDQQLTKLERFPVDCTHHRMNKWYSASKEKMTLGA